MGRICKLASDAVSAAKVDLGREIRKLIGVCGWTQTYTADFLCVSNTTIGFICRGEEWRVSLDSLMIFAITLGASVEVRVNKSSM